MRAILVSVDYADLLAVTLPYNRHHFESVLVVTTPRDEETQRVAIEHGAVPYLTDAFYRGGADFNKWLALEEGLDYMGREGWLCIMDADVLWPKDVEAVEMGRSIKWYTPGQPIFLQDCGQLITPRRRMAPWPPEKNPFGGTGQSLSEPYWSQYPLHRQEREFAGYSQIFHASDPVLGPPPWHETDWKHAGGADSFFQMKWPEERKVRPPWEVLHLGPAGLNWMGRATPTVDGTIDPRAEERKSKVMRIWSRRRELRSKGLDPFQEEKL